MASGPSNQLLEFLHALRRRRYQVLVPALLVSTIGICFAVIVPKTYKISTRIQINEARIEPEFRRANPQESGVRREAYSAYDHVVHYERVKEIIDRNLSQWPEYVQAKGEQDRQLFLKQILKRLWASPANSNSKTGTIFVDIQYSDENPTRAARFLDELSQSWLIAVFEADRTSLRDEIRQLQEIFDDQAKTLKDQQDSLYKQKQLLGVDPSSKPNQARREDRGDWTFRTLDDASTELVKIDSSLRTARFEEEQLRARFELEPEETLEALPLEKRGPPAELMRMSLELEKIEEELKTLLPANSRYKKLSRQAEELRQRLEELAQVEEDPAEKFATKPNPLKREYELELRKKEDEVGQLADRRAALLEQIETLEDETRARTEQYKSLEDLESRAEVARLDLNETSRQLEERKKSLLMLETSPRPWSIAQPPVPSSAAKTPNPFLLAAVSVFLGLALGMGLAILSEYARSSYRTVADLATVMSVPVLGAIETIITRRERRTLQLSRALGGLSTALIVGSLGWITYLWHSAPERLPLEVQDTIERLRSVLK
jgi:capsular polysaccharide biosynthesis protein